VADANPPLQLAGVAGLLVTGSHNGTRGLIGDPAWSSRFRVHHRVADRFRVGGVFLAGDAAHVHSPAAGQGMNTGIADASVLDGYERYRRAAALEVLQFTDRMTRMAMLRNPLARSLRTVAAATAGRIGPIRHLVASWITGLKRSPLRHDPPAVAPRHAERHRHDLS
jgi:2-polyprenyl-6-methoxyphenol hydroxylase-like FAD-dependent oxidoreductase